MAKKKSNPKKKIIVRKTDGKWYEVGVDAGETHPPEWYEQNGWLKTKDDDTTGNQQMPEITRRVELESLLPDDDDSQEPLPISMG